MPQVEDVQVMNKQTEIVDPAVAAVAALMKAARQAGVKRVILISSTDAVVPRLPGQVPRRNQRDGVWADQTGVHRLFSAGRSSQPATEESN